MFVLLLLVLTSVDWTHQHLTYDTHLNPPCTQSNPILSLLHDTGIKTMIICTCHRVHRNNGTCYVCVTFLAEANEFGRGAGKRTEYFCGIFWYSREPINYCTLAAACVHDNRMVCASTPDGCSRRSFLDQCDMYEYNCDFSTQYNTKVTSPCMGGQQDYNC